MIKVAVLVGSLRRESFSRKVARAVAEFAPALSLDFIDIGAVSFFNEDLEANPPADWQALRHRVSWADAVLFVTAEYVRSVPGVLKNAIDICARPQGRGALGGKPAAIISTSLGALGGFGANHHLRQSLASLDMRVLGQPEAYIGNTAALFDADGTLVDERARVFLAAFAKASEAFVRRQVPQAEERRVA